MNITFHMFYLWQGEAAQREFIKMWIIKILTQYLFSCIYFILYFLTSFCQILSEFITIKAQLTSDYDHQKWIHLLLLWEETKQIYYVSWSETKYRWYYYTFSSLHQYCDAEYLFNLKYIHIQTKLHWNWRLITIENSSVQNDLWFDVHEQDGTLNADVPCAKTNPKISGLLFICWWKN